MRLPGKVKAGVGLIVLGIAGFSAIHHWMRTRIVYPLDIPVSLARGHIRTGPFRLNLRTSYMVFVEPGIDQSWEQFHPDCNPYRHLQTRWTLYQNRKVIDQLDEPVVLPWPSGFSAGSGVYELDVEVMSDFRCLDAAGPHLRVIADTEAYEVAAYLLKDVALFGIYVGVILLTFVPVVRLVYSFERSTKLSDSPTAIGQNYQWAQRLPLPRRISGLPAFGLVALTFFAMVGMVVMFFAIPAIPRGVWVRALQPRTAPAKPDRWTEPLIMQVRFNGYGVRGDVFVNSKKVE